MPRSVSQSSQQRKTVKQDTPPAHRHFRLSSHPPHHERYHLALLVLIVLIILSGVSFISSDNPFAYIFRERGKVAPLGLDQKTVAPTSQEYMRDVKQILENELGEWDVSERAVEITKQSRMELMLMRVPRAYLDAHLGLVLLLSRKEQAVERAVQGDSDALESVRKDADALIESYEWLKQ